MSRLERFFLFGLGVLVVLAVAAIFIGPWLVRRDSVPEQQLTLGETETMTARVVEVLEEGSLDLGDGMEHPYQRLLLRVESGSMAGQEIRIEEGTVNIVSEKRMFDVGDRVFVERVKGMDEDRFYISDPVRTTPLLFIGALFVGIVILVGRGRGLRAMGGTLFSLVVLFGVVLPLIKGVTLPIVEVETQWSPVAASVAGSIVLLAFSTYLVYGWNFKAHSAVVGMTLSLVLTWIMAVLFVGWTRLTGLTEEGGFLVSALGADFDLQGLILGGIIIGSLGVLDDACVNQASTVFELINANRDLGWRDLFRSSLNIGRDHIAAMVNTLLLAYVGASMPLMMAFTVYEQPVWRRINREPIAEEIVRTLVGSLGLIMAVPITGLIASLFARWVVQGETEQR